MKLPKLTKNQKISAGIAGGLLAVGTALGIRKVRNNKQENEFTNDADIMNIQVSPGGKTPASFPLKFGHRGNNVKKLQTWLNNQIGKIAMKTGVTLPTLKVDGIFGKNTLKAVRTAFKSDEVTKVSFDKNRM